MIQVQKILFYYLLITVFIIFSSGCISRQSKTLFKTDWLVGTWINKGPKGTIYENWTKKGDKEFIATSYYLKENDTVILETIKLQKERNGWSYIPTVKNQNDGKPVKFKSRIVSDTLLIFENIQHDFPQIITYKKNGEDSLTAEISGVINKNTKKITFPMKLKRE